jgi:hypothetical protein
MTDIPVPSVPLVAPEPPRAPSPYDLTAAQFLAALNSAIALIPAFEPKHPETVKFVHRYLSFSDDLITSTIAAVVANPELAVVKKFDVEKARANDQFMTAYRTVIDAVDELSANLKFTLQARKAETIGDCLQIFAIAKGIGRDPSSASVAAHAENMKRDLRKRPRKATKAGKTPAGKTPAPDPTKPPVTQ